MSQAPRIVLDTTVLIDALRNRQQRRKFLAGLVVSGHDLATSTISIAEVYSGLRAGEEGATQALLAGIEWIPVSAEVALEAGNLKAKLRRQGQTRSITDMVIAATALINGCSVATDNLRDFQIPGLALFPLT